MTVYRAPELDFDDYARPLALKSDQELRVARFVLSTIQRPWLMRMGTALARAGLTLRVPGTKSAIAATVFRQFCGGTDLEEALVCASRLAQMGVGSILDYAVEGDDDEGNFDAVSDEILRVMVATAERDEVAFAAIKMTGIAPTWLLEILNRGDTLHWTDERAHQRMLARLEQLAQHATEHRAAFFIDAEHSWVQDAIDDEAERLMAKYNRDRTVVHTTVQMYLKTGLPYLKKMVRRARDGGYRIGCKLVRGAYFDQENDRADKLGYPSPVQPSKAATDADYDAAITYCLSNLDVVSLCVATHNITSIRHMVAEMARLGVPSDDSRVCSSQLLGMFDRVTIPLADAGYRVHKYLPYGGIRDAFPYLLRRAEENRSVAERLAGELDAVRGELARRKKAGKK